MITSMMAALSGKTTKRIASAMLAASSQKPKPQPLTTAERERAMVAEVNRRLRLSRGW